MNFRIATSVLGFLLMGSPAAPLYGQESDSNPNPKPKPEAEESAPAQKNEGKDKDPAALIYVLFLSEARPLKFAEVKKAMGEGLNLTQAEIDALKLVTGKAGEIRCQHGKRTFCFSAAAKPWLENPEELYAQSREKRLRVMLEQTKANIAIWTEPTPKDDAELDSVCGQMLQILATLVHPADTLALYDNETGDYTFMSREVAEAMAGDDPFAAFDIGAKPDVIEIDGDDPEMKAAVAEARRRWPGFSRAFRQQAGSNFSIKVPFHDGDETEFMWVEVLSIDGKTIKGTLASDPVSLHNINFGDDVSVDISQLNDWFYTRPDGATEGGFTVEVLRKAQQRGTSEVPEESADEKAPEDDKKSEKPKESDEDS